MLIAGLQGPQTECLFTLVPTIIPLFLFNILSLFPKPRSQLVFSLLHYFLEFSCHPELADAICLFHLVHIFFLTWKVVYHHQIIQQIRKIAQFQRHDHYLVNDLHGLLFSDISCSNSISSHNFCKPDT